MTSGGLTERPFAALTAVALLFFLDLFDSVGTLVGVSERAGFLKEDATLPRAGQAFLSDALASCAGALFGTSTVTTYVESASGVASGARTGLAAVITGCCFLLAIAAAPLAAVAGQDVGQDYYAMLGISNSNVAMHPAVAPALIIVGLLMMPGLVRVKWGEPTEGLPAFLTLAGMTLGYGITEGISAGCVSFAAMKLFTGRAREVHPILYVAALLFLLRYVLA